MSRVYEYYQEGELTPLDEQQQLEYLECITNKNNKKMKQTVVEWLLNEMFNNKGLKKEQGITYINLKLVQRAKEIEKQQIIDAFDSGYGAREHANEQLGSEYYNETFKTE